MGSTLRLDGKVCFITGSSRGIGWATAEVFAALGATVILNGRSESAHERAADLRGRFEGEATAVIADMAEPQQVAAAYQQIFKQFKRLDVLVNNAGILLDALLGMIPVDTINRTFAVNAVGPLLNVQEAARLMSRQKSGSIVNVTSIIGTHGNVGQAVYGASKAAVIGLTRSAAKELAPKNIRVNAIAPGFIDTDMTRGLPPEKYQERIASIKMQRIGTAHDVAHAIAFLASDLSSYVTGQVLGVDGGMLI